MTWEAAGFVRDLEQEKALQQVQAALSPGPYDPADLMAFEVSMSDKDGVCSFWQAPIGESQRKIQGFGGKTLPSSVESPFERQPFGLLLNLSGN